MSENKWILYITVPSTLMVIIICSTILYLNNHPYPVNIGFTMDQNALEAVKIVSNYTQEQCSPDTECIDVKYYLENGYYIREYDNCGCPIVAKNMTWSD